jgi:hypothetical protein
MRAQGHFLHLIESSRESQRNEYVFESALFAEKFDVGGAFV